MPRSDSDASILEDHSERLRDVEGRYAAVAAQLAGQSVQIDELGKDIKTGVESLSKKMDDVIGPLRVVSDAVDAHKDQLAKLQEAEDARTSAKTERLKAAKKWVAAAAIAAGALLGEKGAMWIWDHVIARFIH